jgi:hypothetical protein
MEDHMGVISDVVSGMMGGHTDRRAERKNQLKYDDQAFHQRMQNAEQYGIHLLQAIGSSGTLNGTGGLSVGNVMQQGKASRSLRQAQQAQRTAAIKDREDRQSHEMQMLQTKAMIDNAANDRPVTRSLEDDLRNGSNYIFQTKTPFKDAGDYLDDQIERGTQWWENLKASDRKRRNK